MAGTANDPYPQYLLANGARQSINGFAVIDNPNVVGTDGAGFRVQSLPLEWVAEPGEPLDGSELALGFPFPFSDTTWTTAVVDDMGLITFGGEAPSTATTAPSLELLERTDAIRLQWITYWNKVTGGVATMSSR